MNPLEMIKNVSNFELLPEYNFYVDFSGVATMMLMRSNEYALRYVRKHNSNVNATLFEGIERDANLCRILASEIHLKSADLVIALKSVTFPEYTLKTNTKDIGFMNVYTPDKFSLSSSTLKIGFYNRSDNLIKKFFYAWMNMIIDFSTHTKKPPWYYEYDIPIYIFDRNNVLVETRIYNRCFPTLFGGENNKGFDVSSLTNSKEVSISFTINGGMTLDIP